MDYLRLTPLRHTELKRTIAAMMITNQGRRSDPDVVKLVQNFLQTLFKHNNKQNNELLLKWHCKTMDTNIANK